MTASCVQETTVVISWLIWPNSTAGRTARHATATGRVIASEATLAELTDVLSRPKFDAYVTVPERQTFFGLFFAAVDMISALPVIRECRDPRDDKFLELAAGGGAAVIVTGDADLLVMHPFRGIAIETAAAYLSTRS
jgi:putative PIN family toxin of toxin-antitoxin system